MPHLDALWRDLRHAARILLRSPLFTLSAVLTLALCIGANTAIYTVVDRVLLRPLPYPAPDRLAAVVTHFEKTGNEEGSQTGSAWLALQAASPAVDLAVMFDGSMGVNFVSHQQAEYVKQQRVSAGYFRVLGVAPIAGREFTSDEDRVNGPKVAVLSHALWTRALGADPGVIGKAVTLRGESYTVVGVMPADFKSDTPADVWTPLRPSPRGEGAGQNYEIIARLRPGVSWAEADGRVAAAGAAVMKDLYREPSREHLIPLQAGLTERCARASLYSLGRRRRRAAHRLRQHRGAARRAIRGARAGNRDAHGARRRARRRSSGSCCARACCSRRPAAPPASRSARSGSACARRSSTTPSA